MVERETDMSALLKRLGYTFAQPNLFKEALRHPSCGGEHFQRLEFLGDRVLGLIMSHWIYTQFPGDPEGACSKRLAHLVNRHTLATIGERWQLADEMQCSSPSKGAIADGVEALLGAVFLDGGLAAAEKITNLLWPESERLVPPQAEPKTALQEYTQHYGYGLPQYIVVQQTGPSHQPVFTVQVHVGTDLVCSGVGCSKQQAEQKAASMALHTLISLAQEKAGGSV
jgi:ribonuclease-3